MRLMSSLTLMSSAFLMYVPPHVMMMVLRCFVFQEDTASAWGVQITEPIIVFLRFKCMSLYLDGIGQCPTVCIDVCIIVYIVPEIKVYQPSNKDSFCLGVQIGKLVEVLQYYEILSSM